MTSTMPAVGFRDSLPVENPECLLDVRIDVPEPGPHDLLVRMEAVSVNPVDVKVRAGSGPQDEVKVLGYDAAGVVGAVGTQVSRFAVGDEVYYAGSIGRPGTNSRFHAVDERIVGRKPATLSFTEAAAMPLTTVTAWETLFDRLRLTADSTGTLVVLGAAGGVGSMVVQLARALTGLTVIATASRPETREWVTGLGAHHVVDHHGDLAAQVTAIGGEADYLFSPYSAGNVETFAEILRPRGEIVAIDDPVGLDLLPLKSKSITWHWELMFTRPLHSPDDTFQHDLLNRVADLVDAQRLRTTLTRDLGPITAGTLREAHREVERSATIGKLALTGFPES